MLGPVVVLAVPAALVGLGLLVLNLYPCEGTCGQPSLGAWLLVLMAVPTAIAVGLPWIVSPLNIAVALITSLGGWLAFGVWAGRRATEDVDATWRTYWREVGFMTGGVVAGVLIGLAGMGVVLLVV
jgi:hypothetical protein